MADGSENIGGIGYVISAEDLTKLGTESAKKNLQEFGAEAEKHAGKGSAAFKGFGFAAKGVAYELGVTGGMAKLFSHEAVDMASSMGTAAIGLGVVSIAALATAKVYAHFSEQSQKLRETTLKNADASMTWIDAARIDKKETDSLRQAKDELWKVEKDRAQWNLEKGIKEEMKVISELTAKVEEQKRRATMKGDDQGHSLMFTMIYGKKDKRQSDFREGELELRDHIAKLGIMYADLELITGKGKLHRAGTAVPLSPAFTQFEFEQMQEWMLLERSKVEKQKNLDSESTYLAARSNLYKSYGATAEELYQADLAAFDAVTAAKLNAMQNEDDQKEYFAQRSMERMAKEAQQQEQTEKMKQQAVVGTLSNMSSAFSIMSSLGQKHGRQYFSAYKAAATAEAIVSTYLGASKALGQGGVLGPVWAASIIALGMANVAKIRAQEYGGGSGAGGGAVGTFSADSSTGLPNNGYKYFNYEQSQYGSGWRPGQGQMQGNTTVIYAMDSKDVSRVLMDNAGSVAKANDFAQKGYA